MINANDNEHKYGSPPHRHILRRARTQVRAFFSHIAPARGETPTGVAPGHPVLLSGGTFFPVSPPLQQQAKGRRQHG